MQVEKRKMISFPSSWNKGQLAAVCNQTTCTNVALFIRRKGHAATALQMQSSGHFALNLSNQRGVFLVCLLPSS
jgi:hypothetical protein